MTMSDRERAVAVVTSLVALLLTSYKLLIVHLRRKRLAYIASLDPVRDAGTLATLFLNVEFPYLAGKGLGFALFRTYGVPSISKVLVAAGGFKAGAVKRMEDTDLLARELLSHHPDAPRGSYALRRLNFIHGHYRIRNADYLYTLSLFVTTPIDWAERYGFRKPLESEKTAQYVVWHDVGVRMGIRDIPGSYRDMVEFQERYEAEHMVFAPSNHAVAELTLQVILGRAPAALEPLGRRMAYALLDDRVRAAMGFPEQPKWAQKLTHLAHRVVGGSLVAWLLPPRPLSWAVSRIYVDPPAVAAVPESFRPDEVRKLKTHLDTPAVYPDGYRIGDLGPFHPGRIGDAFPGDLRCPLSSMLHSSSAK